MADLDDVLDRLAAVVSELAEQEVTDDEALAVYDQLKAINGRIWKIMREVEAGRVRRWYDLYAEIAAALADPPGHLSRSDVWLDLLGAGAVTVAPDRLLRQLRGMGIDPTRTDKTDQTVESVS